MPESLPLKADGAETSSLVSTTLLERVRLGEAAAWERLVHLVGPLVYQWCRGWGLQEADAEDVHQEVFRSVAEQVRTFRREKPADSFRGWLWGIARHKFADHIRQQKRHPQAPGGTGPLKWIEQIPEAGDLSGDRSLSVETRDHVLMVHQALDSIRGHFTPKVWQAFLATVIDGRPCGEVASELNMSKGAVYHAAGRVVQRVREVLGGLV